MKFNVFDYTFEDKYTYVREHQYIDSNAWDCESESKEANQTFERNS